MHEFHEFKNTLEEMHKDLAAVRSKGPGEWAIHRLNRLVRPALVSGLLIDSIDPLDQPW
jgi:hypothetical protein